MPETHKLNTDQLASEVGGWKHKAHSAAEVNWWSSDFRLYKPHSEQVGTSLEITTKSDHMIKGLSDDHSKSVMVIDETGAIVSLDVTTQYSDGTAMPEALTKTIEAVAGILVGSAVVTVGGIVTAATTTADGVVTLGTVAPATAIAGTVLTGAAASAASALAVGAVSLVADQTSKIGELFEDGGTVMFPSANALFLAMTYSAVEPQPFKADTRVDFDEDAFAASIAASFKDKVSWKKKDGTTVVEYAKGDDAFRTWRPVWVDLAYGGKIMAMKVDHDRNDRKDDHANVLMLFNPGGTLVCTLLAVAQNESSEVWSTGMVPDLPALKDGDEYPLGLTLAATAKAKLDSQMKEVPSSNAMIGGGKGLENMSDTIYANLKAAIESVSVS